MNRTPYPWEYRALTDEDCYIDRRRKPGESPREWFRRLIIADECLKRLHPDRWESNRRKKNLPPIPNDGVPFETKAADMRRWRADYLRKRRAEG